MNTTARFVQQTSSMWGAKPPFLLYMQATATKWMLRGFNSKRWMSWQLPCNELIFKEREKPPVVQAVASPHCATSLGRQKRRRRESQSRNWTTVFPSQPWMFSSGPLVNHIRHQNTEAAEWSRPRGPCLEQAPGASRLHAALPAVDAQQTRQWYLAESRAQTTRAAPRNQRIFPERIKHTDPLLPVPLQESNWYDLRQFIWWKLPI